MKGGNQSKSKLFILISIICLLIPFSIYGLWIYVFGLATTEAERVAIFNSWFPNFLSGRWSINFISITFCVAAIIFSSISLTLSQIYWKLVILFILILSTILLGLNLFSMM